MASVVSAISASCELIAVHSPQTASISSSESKQRLVVKLYDAKVSLGTLKFTLTTQRPATEAPKSAESQSGSLAISQLFFCGAQDEYLVAALSDDASASASTSTSPPQPIVVWDLKRGVVCHNIELPKQAALCAATGGQHQRHLYLLLRMPHDSKLVVYVHDLDSPSAKLLKKVKIGSCDSPQNTASAFAIALHEPSNLVAVQYGKRIKISPLAKDLAAALRFKIKGSHMAPPAAHAHRAAPADTIAFSHDGALLIVAHTNGLLFYSTADGAMKASAPILSSSSSLHSYSQAHLHLHNHALTAAPDDTPILVAATQHAAARASLFHIAPQSLQKNMKHFATITSPTTDAHATGTANEQPPKSLHRVYFPRGKRGRNTLLLLELTPRGIHGDAQVHLSELPYRTTSDANDDNNEHLPDKLHNTASSLLQGELYPTHESDDTHTNNLPTNTPQSKKKRKIGNVALGPGEAGAEAMNVSDSRILLKKQKTIDESSSDRPDDNDNGDFDFLNLGNEQDGNKEADDGTTIAERLALLSSELDRDSDEDDDHDDDPKLPRNGAAKSKPKVPITSDSLLTLLRQALCSNDDSQLEIALQVSDKKMIKNSIDALCAESVEQDFSGTNLVMTLLSKLTTRLSRKAGRAERLSFWVSATLVSLISSPASATSNSWSGDVSSSTLLEMGTTQMEIATHLGPLRNMLSERVESLPSLLKLEGRLGLLGKLS